MHFSTFFAQLALAASATANVLRPQAADTAVKRQSGVSVTFNELANTTFGESIVVVGSISQLGTWNAASGVALSSSKYTASNPLWSGSVSIPAGTTFQYKYVKVETDGTFGWESDPNHSYTVPSSGAATARSDTWQCTPATAVQVTFNEVVTTAWQESVYVVGSIAQLGSWAPAQGAPLSAAQYTSANPLWSGNVTLAPGVSFSYKYVKVAADGTITWESGSDHIYTVPSGCSTSASISNTWASASVTTSIASASTSSAAPTPTCVNSATSRNCWSSGFDINTDFDTNWPQTGRTVSYDLTITNITMSPDGVSRSVFAVNGQYPGPTLFANWGDMISVTLHNNLPNNGTTIHFHGIRQWHSNTQDGVPGVTECPLAPGQSKTYLFRATQYGTSWYHSHFSCQYGDGVLGPIVIYGPATANYDLDVGALPISDWYYATVNHYASITAHTNGSPPIADTGLINGTMVSSSGGKYARTTLTAGKRHRLRLINTAVDNHFMVSLDNHILQVISSDFVPIVPYNTTWLFLGIGQRYDVIITANQASANYWFRAEVQDTAGCGGNWNNHNILSVFSYGGKTGNPTSTATTYTQRCTDETGIVPYWNSYVPIGQIQTPVFMGVSLNQTTGANGALTLYWNVNGSSLDVDWANPTLNYVEDGKNNFPQRANLITLPTAGVWTYWVIQGLPGNPYDVEVPHPIHLHGHDFYILGTGSSTWSAANAKSLNYNNPTRRDVAMLPSGGWLALAFQTDNPGAWLMHCHIAWHADEGFAVQFLESASSIQSVSPIGTAFDNQCSAWSSFYPSKAAYIKGDSGI